MNLSTKMNIGSKNKGFPCRKLSYDLNLSIAPKVGSSDKAHAFAWPLATFACRKVTANWLSGGSFFVQGQEMVSHRIHSRGKKHRPQGLTMGLNPPTGRFMALVPRFGSYRCISLMYAACMHVYIYMINIL